MAVTGILFRTIPDFTNVPPLSATEEKPDGWMGRIGLMFREGMVKAF